MRTCTKCSQSKSESEFYFKDKAIGRLHTQCKQCYKEHRIGYYQTHYDKYKDQYRKRAKARRDKLRKEFRENMLSFLQDKYCVMCGESDIRTLEFDHLDPKNKKFGIAQSVHLGYYWGETLLEINKCRILCANCHKKHTSSQYNWYKSI